jgi:CBS domain-containing protein
MTPTFRQDEPMQHPTSVTAEQVMTRSTVSVPDDASVKEVVRVLETNRIDAVPIVDADLHVVGVASASDLLNRFGVNWRDRLHHRRPATTARELMTVPPITTGPDTPVGDVARLASRAHVHNVPVVDPQGVLIGIVTRRDLAKVFLRSDDELREEVEGEVTRRRRAAAPGAVHVAVDDGVVMLTGEVATGPDADRIAEAAARVIGVVDVCNYLRPTAG